ncbi:MAG TPA: UDP-N-acetylglucosamine 2-epimerase (non-hydrolyzing), partial [Methanobacteriales archaeon]|nr:UDP-N-acetylglucosamine 2-epimerase (non-hydrolyzing) [Methanobacteriales archaeon]
GKLTIKPPVNILSDLQRELHFIEEDITVQSLEERDKCKVRIVYDGVKPRFPHQTMNLKGKQIICDIYKIL